jgi:hypothetical protein
MTVHFLPAFPYCAYRICVRGEIKVKKIAVKCEKKVKFFSGNSVAFSGKEHIIKSKRILGKVDESRRHKTTGTLKCQPVAG